MCVHECARACTHTHTQFGQEYPSDPVDLRVIAALCYF